MTHTIPADNYATTLTVIKRVNGNEKDRVSVKSTTLPNVPAIGDFYQLDDNVDGKKLSGIVTKVNHKNGVSHGPVFIGSIEVILE